MRLRKYVRQIAYILSLLMLATSGSLHAQLGGGINNPPKGVSVAGTNVWTGDNRFTDSLFFLRDDGDPTKLAQFQASGITGATTRTYTLPNASSTLCVKDADCAWSVTQSPAANVGLEFAAANGYIRWNGSSGLRINGSRADETPDGPQYLTGSLSNSIVMKEQGDITVDSNNGPCAGVACTNPTLIINGATVTSTKYLSLHYDNVNGVISTGLGALKVSSASGMIISTGSAPTVSACGSSPSGVTGSNTAGRLTTGSGAALQSCTLTFVPALAAAPSCVCNNETNILTVRGIATTTTLVCDSAVAGTLESDVITYICLGGT